MKNFKLSYLILFIVEIAFGILMLVYTDDILQKIAIALGVCTIIYGLIKGITAIRNIKKDDEYLAHRFNLVLGFLLVFIGIFVIVMKENIANIFPIMFGSYIVISSLLTLGTTFMLKKAQSTFYLPLLISSLIMLTGGVLIAINPKFIVDFTLKLTGILFIGRGVLDIIALLCSQIIYSTSDNKINEDGIIEGNAVEVDTNTEED